MNISLLKSEIEKIKNLNNSSDTFDLICKVSKITKNPSSRNVEKIISADLHINFFDSVLSSHNFKDSLFKIVESERNLSESEKNKINKTEKQYIQTSLYLACFIFTQIFSSLDKNEVARFRERIFIKIENIRRESQFTLTDICFSMYDSIQNFDYGFKKEVSREYDVLKIFKINSMSRCIVGSMLLILPEINVFQIKFKKIFREKTEKTLSITRGLCEVFSISKKISGGIRHFCRKYAENGKEDEIVNFIDLFFTNNEKNILVIFAEISSNFHFQENKTVRDIFLEKMNNAAKIQVNISNYTKKNLEAFQSEENNGSEWSNKIFIISTKLLSALDTIKDSMNTEWKINVIVYELFKWIENVHKILNKYDIEDGWDKIKDILFQENSRVEWKSTFWTPTEELFIDDEVEKKKGRVILSKIIEPMIGMMNTDGGTILVGLVENPEAVKRNDIRNNLLVKNSFTFFDTDYEFKKKNKSLDNVKREIQDLLFSMTLNTAEKFNDLWTIEPVEIKENYSVAKIYKIDVKKSERLIHNVKKEAGAIWIALTKRGDGRTIKVDPREYM